jgi:hypothetical protein
MLTLEELIYLVNKWMPHYRRRLTKTKAHSMLENMPAMLPERLTEPIDDYRALVCIV